MKNFCFISFFSFSCLVFSQDIQISRHSEVYGGEYKFNENNISCVSPELRQQIDSIIGFSTRNFKQLHDQRPMTTLFEWPVRGAVDSPYFDIWAISNFVDHNTSFPNQNQDYNCGQRTYDTSDGYNHQGVDIFTWPFSWDQFYNNHSEVIAAAPGTIVFKSDGNFDQNCAFNSGQWNAIYVQHADGSLAMYGHMKSNTLTSKDVGDNVQTGEFLGVIGSSGNSTGPHLHFEIFDNAGNLIDPYSGSCNGWNTTSWWTNQKDYREPNINAVMTHNAMPAFNPCPQPADINAQNDFAFGETIYLASYFRDQIAGTQAQFSLYAEGNLIDSWSFDMQDTYNASYWVFTYIIQSSSQDIIDMVFETSYNGQTESHSFQVGNLGLVDINEDHFEIYPNPVQGQLNITLPSSVQLQSATMYDLLGKATSMNIGENNILNTANLSSGVYILKLETNQGVMTKKVIKN